MNLGNYTYEEITTQTTAWENALAVSRAQKQELEWLESKGYEQILFTGCGSTYYLSLAAAALFQELTGKSARAVPGGELLLNPRIVLSSKRTLLVAASRSGATTETVRAVERFQFEKCGDVVAITNYSDQPLAKLADLAIVIENGQEQSVAQTRSFASMYVAATALTACFAKRDDLLDEMDTLPETGKRIMREYESVAKELGGDSACDRFYFLGSGSRYGLACECNLKMKEMSLTHGEAFHLLEFRHGPMSMVGKSASVIGMLSDANRRVEQRVLTEMESLGGKVVSLGETDTQIAFQSRISETARNVLYLPILQLMAYYRSKAKGLNPDQPTNLSSVVTLDVDQI